MRVLIPFDEPLDAAISVFGDIFFDFVIDSMKIDKMLAFSVESIKGFVLARIEELIY